MTRFDRIFDQQKRPFEEPRPNSDRMWRVYRDYEWADGEHDTRYLRAVINDPDVDLSDATNLLALDSDVVVGYAALADGEPNEDRVVEWVKEFGVPGVSYTPYSREHLEYLDSALTAEANEGYGLPASLFSEVVRAPLVYSDTGGSGETLDAIVSEARAVREVLTVYDAAVNRDRQVLKELLFAENKPSEEMSSRVRQFEFNLLRGAYERSDIHILSATALHRVHMLVNERLSHFAYPALVVRNLPFKHEPGNELPGLGQYSTLLRPRNLLGAIFLKLHDLIVSGEPVRGCKYCGKPLSFGRIRTKNGGRGRKLRTDRKYCDKSCRQRAEYRRKTKSSRGS